MVVVLGIGVGWDEGRDMVDGLEFGYSSLRYV